MEAWSLDEMLGTNVICRWKDPGNNWRKKWNINAVPTLVKYTLVQDGDGISQEQLVEEDAKDLEKLRAFVRSTNTYSL